MSESKDKKHPPERSALDVARAGDAPLGDHDLPPVQNSKKGEPGNADDPHHGQSGHGGSGKDSTLQSVGQSQSDRAAGKSS